MPARPTSRQIRSGRHAKALLLDMACRSLPSDEGEEDDPPRRLYDVLFRSSDQFTQAHFEDC